MKTGQQEGEVSWGGYLSSPSLEKRNSGQQARKEPQKYLIFFIMFWLSFSESHTIFHNMLFLFCSIFGSLQLISEKKIVLVKCLNKIRNAKLLINIIVENPDLAFSAVIQMCQTGQFLFRKLKLCIWRDKFNRSFLQLESNKIWTPTYFCQFLGLY